MVLVLVLSFVVLLKPMVSNITNKLRTQQKRPVCNRYNVYETGLSSQQFINRASINDE